MTVNTNDAGVAADVTKLVVLVAGHEFPPKLHMKQILGCWVVAQSSWWWSERGVDAPEPESISFTGWCNAIKFCNSYLVIKKLEAFNQGSYIGHGQRSRRI